MTVICVDVVPSIGDPLTLCLEQTSVLLASAWIVLFWDLHRIPMTKNSTECHPVPPLGALPGCKTWPVETPYSLTRSPHYEHLHSIQGGSIALGFQACPPSPANCSHSFSFYVILIYTWSSLSLLHLPHLHLQNVFGFCFPGRSMCVS